MNDKLSIDWVRGSIFYERSAWHKLLSEAIYPFLEREKELIDTYNMQLNISPRDHIKISLRSVSTNNVDLEMRFLDFMDNYLLNNPSDTTDKTYKFYPNNTAWTNQYNEKDFYLSSEPDYLTAREKISATFKALTTDIIAMSDIYTLIFYLQLGMLKTFFGLDSISQKLHELTVFLKNEYSPKDKFISLATEKSALSFVSTNKDILISIIEDIWNSIEIKHGLTWLDEWLKDCTYFSKRSEDFNKNFIVICKLMYDCLGLASKKLLPLSLLILTETFKNKEIYKYQLQAV